MNPGIERVKEERKWFAVFTVPQNEKSVVRHFDMRAIESFLPTFETFRTWQNRQRKKIVLPLFPCYVFVRVAKQERAKVLQCPGVIHIVGNGKEHVTLPDSDIDVLRSECNRKRIEPYNEFLLGERVRVRRGVMQGLQGTLVRIGQGVKFVFTIDLINQHVAIQADAEDLEPIV